MSAAAPPRTVLGGPGAAPLLVLVFPGDQSNLRFSLLFKEPHTCCCPSPTPPPPPILATLPLLRALLPQLCLHPCRSCQTCPACTALSRQAPQPCSQQSPCPFACAVCTPQLIQADAVGLWMPQHCSVSISGFPLPPLSLSPGFACPLPPHALSSPCLPNPFSFPSGLLVFAFPADAFTFEPAHLLPGRSPATWSSARCLEAAGGCSLACCGLWHALLQPLCSQTGETRTAEMATGANGGVGKGWSMGCLGCTGIGQDPAGSGNLI